MKTTETQKLPETQQKVLDFIHKFSDSNVDYIADGTQLNKLLVFKAVKVLADKKLLVKSENNPVTYKLPIDDAKKPNTSELKSIKTEANADEKGTNVSGKKSAKIENTAKVEKEIIAGFKTESKKKETAVKGNDEVALPKTGGRDTSKLKFNGELYGKGKLVLAVVKKYMEDNPKTTFAKLKEVFPDTLQPRYGMIEEVNKAKKISADRDRYFLKPEDLIKVGDKKIAVTNQIGANNLPPVLKQFRALGYTIK